MSFWVHLAAAKHPDRLAIEAPDRSLTYAELSRAVVAGAQVLEGMDVAAGERVALALPASAEFVIALHACIVHGVAAVPIDLRLTEDERGRRLAGASVVVSEPLRGRPATRPTTFGGDAPIAVMHTSGTTADPKQVVLSYGNWLASALGSAVALGLDPAERWLCPMPLTHVGGLSIPIRSAIYATTAVLHGRFNTAAVLAELMDPARRITLVSLVPTMLVRLLDAGLEHPSTLRWALVGGGPIAPALLERAQAAGVPVAPSYGLTEACSQVATHGWPLVGVEIRTHAGEVVVRGATVSAGALAEDGWLHTGDLGRFDDRAGLQIIGRISDTIVTGGENVAPAEVESVLLEHPAVADAAVHGRADPEWGETVVATVVLRDGIAAGGRDGMTVGAEELRRHCASRLASFKVPKAFQFAERLPRTESGKLVRRELS